MPGLLDARFDFYRVTKFLHASHSTHEPLLIWEASFMRPPERIARRVLFHLL